MSRTSTGRRRFLRQAATTLAACCAWPRLLWAKDKPRIRFAILGINHEHVQVEGPNARKVEVWRGIHWDYFGNIMRSMGREPSMQMPVIFHRFELLYPRR